MKMIASTHKNSPGDQQSGRGETSDRMPGNHPTKPAFAVPEKINFSPLKSRIRIQPPTENPKSVWDHGNPYFFPLRLVNQEVIT